jgi:ATP-dependent RNA helicase DHX8/PRP22
MDDLLELELIGLANKVASELQNHIGVNDKTLAEFIISQRLEHPTFQSFEQRMADIGGESLSRSVYEVSTTLYD